MSTPQVVGLDLSLTATGIAGHDGLLHTAATTGRGDARLTYLRHAVAAEIQRGADLAVIEDLPTHARAAGITGMVHGVVRCLLLDVGVPYALVPPASLKRYAVGKGNATKPDMRMALYQRTGMDVRSDDEVDAYWLRAMGLDRLGRPEITMPGTHRTALGRAQWPDLGEGVAMEDESDGSPPAA